MNAITHNDNPPLMELWTSYEGSADSMRLTPSVRKGKFRSWSHFSSWMRDFHPEIRDLRAVTRLVCEQYVGSFHDAHAAATCNIRLYDLRAIFDSLLADIGIDANPWRSVRPRSPDTRVRRALSSDELCRLFSSAAAEGLEWRTLFAIGVYTGLRLGDCCRLSWEHIDMEHAIIQLVPHKTRRFSRGRTVTIPIHSQLMSALAEISPECRFGAVLPHIASDFLSRRWSVSKSLDRIFTSAGIVTSVAIEGRSHMTPAATFHSLRHSFVSFAANAGVPLVVVQSIVGHSSSAMTRHYYHADESALRAAVDAIPAFVAGTSRVPRSPNAREDSHSGALPAGPVPVLRPRSALPRLSMSCRLRRIKTLLEKGLVNAEEYAALRQRILCEA